MTRVLVTRPREADELVSCLAAADIEAIHVPTIRVRPGEPGRLAAELRNRRDGDWTVITSANGAAAVIEALGKSAGMLAGRVVAIGPATAEALRADGLRVDAVPVRSESSAIPAAMGNLARRRVLLARGNLATPRLAADLRAAGAEVVEVVAYRTVEGPPESRPSLLAALDAGLDGLLFTSGSSARGLLRLLPAERRPAAHRVPAFCIGPATAATARAAGFFVAAQAPEQTAAGLAAITIQHFATERT